MLNLEGARLRSRVGFASSCGWRRSTVDRILTSRRAYRLSLAKSRSHSATGARQLRRRGEVTWRPVYWRRALFRHASRADSAAANFTSMSDDTAAGHNYRHWQSSVTLKRVAHGRNIAPPRSRSRQTKRQANVVRKSSKESANSVGMSLNLSKQRPAPKTVRSRMSQG
jgi:hypothetical protein